ncbi:MAG: glycosyltransferase family 2 protein [Archaeoglobus sp.]|nr:glycosyltransferase family 2 protein [Archaeoglobus sp.]
MFISVILPTLNEEESISECIDEIREGIEKLNEVEDYEIIVVDSSTDRTAEIAKQKGAVVVRCDRKGYGYAYLEGFKVAKGDVIVMGDADGTYNFLQIPGLIKPILNGEDLVIGSRFMGKMEDGAMNFLNRIGNRLLTSFLNKTFKLSISDSQSGFRAIKKSALERLNLKADGMEFASEMIIEAFKKGLKVVEVGIDYRKRKGSSKLRSFKDGWRHLRLMLLYNPHSFLIYPGLILAVFGFLLMAVLYLRGNVEERSMHSFILGAIVFLSGLNSSLFGLMISAYSGIHGYSSSNLSMRVLSYHSLERELFVGIGLILAGILIGLYILHTWISSGYGSLSQMGLAVTSLVLISSGLTIVYSAFFMSMLLLER